MKTNNALSQRVAKLRSYIKEREAELNIQPDHDESGHYYKDSSSPRYPSVTAKLQILKDPALANWKMNRALWYVENELAKWQLNSITTELDITAIIEGAKELPTTEFTNAGNIGSQVHAWREEKFKYIIEHGVPVATAMFGTPFSSSDPAVIAGCRGIQAFIQDTGYIPLACELALVDHELKLGGMVDDIGILPGKRNRLVVIDLKTSNIGDKTSYYYQVALYFYMFWKLYKIKPQGAYILHVSKENGGFKLIELPDIPQLIREAKYILKVNDAIDRVNASKVKEPIVI